MQRCTRTNGAHHLHARPLAVGALDVNDLIALAHAQVDRLLNLLVQLTHGQQRGITHIQTSFDQIAQFQQTHAQAITASFRAIDESAHGEVIENAVCSRGV